MTRRSFAILAMLAGALPAHATPAPPPETFVLIVTNNRSSELGRPALSYADDDGAKYYEVYRAVAPAAHVHLLTEFDRDTLRLFPALANVVQPPTKHNVSAVVAQISGEVAAARRAGRAAEFTFVFAGHGDVDAGRGFLELGDGRLTSDDLEALLSKVAATTSHVILDSCNSFFVINARKPGGRRFATPADAAESLGKRLPNVGVFLSTSAESEVFEWSELQSGIFSHAVRSGLLGAADANGDGAVSYEELAAFVDTATIGVKNPSFRPKVFARGPNNNRDAVLFSAGRSPARTLTLDTARSARITVRDADDLPWLDLFKEAGAAMALHLPPNLDTATIEELEVTATGSQVVARRRVVADVDGQGMSLDTVALADPTHAARGPNELFRMLFTHPFGPRAVVAYRTAEASEPPPVYGISREDSTRMNLLLTQIGGAEHGNRMLGAYGLSMLGVGIGATAFAIDEQHRVARYALLGIGTGVLIGGIVARFRQGPAEKLHDRLLGGLAGSGDPDAVVADIERRLDEVARDYHQTRLLVRGGGIGMLAINSVLFALNERNAHNAPAFDPTVGRIAYGAGLFVGGLALVSSLYEFPIERMAHLWSSDPAIHRTARMSIAPSDGGFLIGATGSF